MGGKLTQKNGKRMAGGKPIPKSSFALPNANGGQGAYPIDTVNRARNALARVSQFGSDDEKAKVNSAVQRRYSQINVGGVQTHANGYNFADGDSMRCPNCGHTGDADEFKHSDSDYDNDSSRSNGNGAGGASGGNVGATPQPQADSGATGYRPQQTSVRGMANGGRGMEFARRMPVRTTDDVVVSRKPGGGAYIRHRQGGGLIGELNRNDDGTWQSVIDGQALSPHSRERGAFQELVGRYNSTALTPERQPMPLQQPPVQPELFSQLGIHNVRAFASDDGSDDDSSDDDSGSSDSNGLSPRGQAIYKKLTGKGVAPKVALAMAKRAQNTKPGVFGQQGS